MKRLVFCALLLPAVALADAPNSRFSAGGYFRIMTRPDFEGGDAKLGLWNIGGRLLNEGPYGMLQLQLGVLQSDPASGQPWANVNARIEGGSFASADTGGGGLANFRATALFVGSYQNTAMDSPPNLSVKQARSPTSSSGYAFVSSPSSTPSTRVCGFKRASTEPIVSFASALKAAGSSATGYFLPSNKS